MVQVSIFNSSCHCCFFVSPQSPCCRQSPRIGVGEVEASQHLKKWSVTRRIWQKVQPVTWSPRGPSCSAATVQEWKTAINPVMSIRLRQSVSPDPRQGSRHDLPFLSLLSRTWLSLVAVSGRTAAPASWLQCVCLVAARLHLSDFSQHLRLLGEEWLSGARCDNEATQRRSALDFRTADIKCHSESCTLVWTSAILHSPTPHTLSLQQEEFFLSISFSDFLSLLFTETSVVSTPCIGGGKHACYFCV